MAVADCSRCDAVCCRLTAILEADDAVPLHLTTEHSGGKRAMARGEDGWCVAMDRTQMRCGIYDIRPAVCHRFTMAGPYCEAIREDYYEHGSAQS